MPRRALLLASMLVLACSKGSESVAAPTTPGDPVMNVPFASASDVASVNEGFSSSASAPWGFAHLGVDFTPSSDLRPFVAAASGTVMRVSLNQNSSTANWQVNVEVAFNATYGLDYIFEPFSTSAAVGQTQLSNVVVRVGQSVATGDLMGRLVYGTSGAHLHFDLRKNGAFICPEPYFSASAAAAILAVMHKSQPTWSMCY